MNLYESSEDYLERILMLNKEGKKVRSIDLAKSFNYSRASISRAINNLADDGYIDIIDSILILTEKGKEIAEKMLERHLLLSTFFMKIGVSEKNAFEDACKIEHDMSDETYDKLIKLLKEKKYI
jgi:Mn-dependent DtxR family transcriptional regulator